MALLTQLSASQVRQAVCSIARVAASAGATSAHAGAADNSYSCRYMSTPAPLSSYSLPADLQPRLYNGKHYQPRISARQAADLRKKLILAAMNGVDVGLRWDPSWERANKSVITRLPKGTRHDLKIKDRVEKIKAAIAPGVQDKKYADYRKTLPPKPPAEGLIRWVKKNAWEKD